MDASWPTCPFCAEEIPPRRLKCPRCGEALVAQARLLESLEAVAADPALSALLADWTDEDLSRALREYVDDYGPPQQRAIVDEAQRRGLTLPARRVGGRSALDIGCMVAGLCLLAYVALGAVGALLGR